ncbi:General secretion pathway protein C [Bathymodiolus thermophilus thioautotrophic gill symbiont]|uniref:Type II secretion system protein GspC N-terminal domain-containing protein n=1 Tax=Bathymodiolus thermophilus thioautotrophic gill symbiont TaxID=2360 RepID=A0A8H8XBK5_9GAMM|nr:type II secretion system protein N [Bathymodiolus thermophilus thioautotrophic gill symbiont]CAB5500856.1 hypothetical protein THERMOS_1279 [Bathymodiolus thermophilus thioautotrophic gill symbiont]SGZ59299.1 General secretion pathway protein C [Bathymodiolus thermophilus thioautotrophic gill symbiont]
MDLKTVLPANWIRIKRLSVSYQDKIRVGITLCLVVYLAYVCAQLALGLFINAQSQVVAAIDIKTPRSNANNMRAYNNLFGQFQRVKIRQDYKKVKLTPLNLTLVGTVFKRRNALAIIKNGRKKAKIYRQGDKIIAGVLLKDIAKDYVVIERGEKLEKILIKFKYVDPNANSRSKVVELDEFKQNKFSSTALSAKQKNKLGGYLKEISKNPRGLLSLIRIEPNFSDGKLIGFRINSSKEKHLFKELGFREHDVITRINDTMLDSLSASFKIVGLLKKTKNFDIYLDREGEQHIITIDLN